MLTNFTKPNEFLKGTSSDIGDLILQFMFSCLKYERTSLKQSYSLNLYCSTIEPVLSRGSWSQESYPSAIHRANFCIQS